MENIVTLLGEDKAEPDQAATVVGVVDVAVSRPAVPVTAVPTATTIHAVRPTGRTSGISLGTAAIGAIPVLAPLLYVAAHIVDAQLIGLLGAYGMSLATRIFCPSYIANGIAATVLIALTPITATGCKLPLCLGRQTEMLTSKRVQLRDESLAIIPADILHRSVIAL